MNGHPEPPPEGALIEAARRDAGLSVREAARRAQISEGWWRQVVKGYQTLSGGGYGLVRDVPAATIARMARAAGVEPEQLATAGERPDAAQAMRELRERPVPVPRPPVRAAPSPDEEAEAAVYEPVVLRRVKDLAAEGNLRPDGAAVFLAGGILPGMDPEMAGDLADGWDRAMRNPLLDAETAAGFAARTWVLLLDLRTRQDERRSGQNGALAHT